MEADPIRAAEFHIFSKDSFSSRCRPDSLSDSSLNDFILRHKTGLVKSIVLKRKTMDLSISSSPQAHDGTQGEMYNWVFRIDLSRLR